MRVWVQSDSNKNPKTISNYAASNGFRSLGFEVVPFFSFDDIKECNPSDLIVGGIGYIEKKMGQFGIELPELNYPKELSSYLCRKVWKDTIDKVMQPDYRRPIFVKPIREKRFTGLVLYNHNQLPRLTYCEKDEPVLCSEVLDIQSEWRAFIRYGQILDIRPYYGDWKYVYNPITLQEIVRAYLPYDVAGYSLDIGILKDGRDILIELNDGFSLGYYGLDEVKYAKLLSARWCELVGIHDECDITGDKYYWKKNKCK